MTYQRTIEVIAKSEEEARSLAEKQLGSNEKIAKSETLSAPARGIFGFVGRQEYKIRFHIEEKPAKTEEVLVEKIAEKPTFNDAVAENFEEAEDLSEMPVRRPRHMNNDNRGSRNNSRSNGRRDNNRRDGRRNRRPERSYEGVEDFSDAEEHINMPERPKEPVTEEIKNNTLYSEIFDLIQCVAKNVGVEEIQLNDFIRDGAWVIDASGENVSQLIGKHGKTLDSLQFLMNIVFNKGKDERTKIVLDAQGYREKRYRNLIMLAKRMSRKAVSGNRPVELEPMSTLDRRTVHMALKDNEEIETFSKGVEPMRRVVIAPVHNKKKGTSANNEWQPLVVDDNDSEASNTTENTAVPMFMEEDV
ncbi:MAG: KH domain-containing protein [Candidatus Riflebacteria bacterium]|nr:KH domain-containing protein [Candidatus Riflebacteria bacterium]